MLNNVIRIHFYVSLRQGHKMQPLPIFLALIPTSLSTAGSMADATIISLDYHLPADVLTSSGKDTGREEKRMEQKGEKENWK